MTAFLALDQGTTSSRALVYDAAGRELARAQQEFTQHFPRPGWVEHDPEEIWTTQWQSAERAWRAAGAPPILGVGITNQRETVVVFDRRTSRPIHRAIVWQDRRTTEHLQALRSGGHEAAVLRATGLPLDPYFSAAKIAWILDSVPGARAAAERGELGAATVDAWLVYRLTGGKVFATEPSNASRTSLYDLESGGWSDELCAWFGVPRAMLPEIRPSAGAFGACATHGWPITGVVGDQQAALFGQGCLAVGAAKCTFGTGAFLLCNVGERRPHPPRGLLATVAWRLGGTDTFAVEGSVLVSGALVQWLRDGLQLFAHAREVETLARSVPDSAGLAIVPAFAGLGSPHWDPDARGAIFGITRGATRAHLARAALEAMALQAAEQCELFAQALHAPLAELRVDGGAAGNDLLLGILATVAGIPVRRNADLESTALGACRMAMLGAGVARGPADLPPPAAGARVFAPGEVPVDATGLRRAFAEAVRRTRGWARAAADGASTEDAPRP